MRCPLRTWRGVSMSLMPALTPRLTAAVDTGAGSSEYALYSKRTVRLAASRDPVRESPVLAGGHGAGRPVARTGPLHPARGGEHGAGDR